MYLAKDEGNELARVDDITEPLDVRPNDLSEILRVLARSGALSPPRGPRGGFRLRVGAAKLTLDPVLAPFDEVTGGSGCLLGRQRCSGGDPCAAVPPDNGLPSRTEA